VGAQAVGLRRTPKAVLGLRPGTEPGGTNTPSSLCKVGGRIETTNQDNMNMTYQISDSREISGLYLIKNAPQSDRLGMSQEIARQEPGL